MSDKIEPTEKNGKSLRTGRFVLGNEHGFKKGTSGNPKGRPRKAEILKELDKELGAVPREVLYQIIDQASNKTQHFKKSSAVALAIERAGLAEIIKIATYLDEQSNGKAKLTTEIEGAIIMLSTTADEL